MKNLERVGQNSVLVLEPAYFEGRGDVTKVLLDDGREFIEERKISTVVQYLCRLHNINLVSLKYTYGKLIGRKNLVPIPLNIDCVLVAIKMRHPMLKGDSAYGYVKAQSISMIKRMEDGSVLLLKQGADVQCLESTKSIERKRRQAQLVAMLYREQVLGRRVREVYMVREDDCANAVEAYL